MKIYINNLNLDLINNITDIFKEYLLSSEIFLNVYTDQGFYMINNKEIFLLNPIDIDIQIFENYYNSFTLILDPSFFKKELITSVNGEAHLSIKIKKDIYKINKKSNIQMVVEYDFSNIKPIINDIYFEIIGNKDINQLFIKEEIIEFLSRLN